MRRIDAGFTLIEMMAAAVILAFVVMWLTATVGTMNRQEGDARRRAEAALYADRLLAELEEATVAGKPLQLGKREVEEGIYRATIELAPLDPALLPAASAPAADGAAPGAAPTSATSASAPGSSLGAWLAAPSAKDAPPVVQATIRVTGTDGRFEAGVTRTSFFLNPAALEALGKASDEAPAGDEPAPAGEEPPS